jgi:2'-phosphotransferase
MADQEAHLDALRDTAQPRPSKRGDRGPRRGGKPMDREVQVSKALSKLLRHQADSAGIKLDKEGFAPLDRVVCLVVE